MKRIKYILTILLLLSVELLAKNNVATITALKGNADIKRDSSLLLASIGDKLNQKDNILTKSNSKVQIIFEDETVVSIGKNSEFSIQEYLFEDNAAPIAKFSMLKGAMRTITGQIGDIAPNRFSVSTKTATIGIRGTNFSVFVEDDGSSSAFCTYGAISVAVGGVTHIVPQGFYINVSPSGKVEIKELTPKVLKAAKEKHFDADKKEKTAKADVGDGKGDGTDEGSGSQLNVTVDENSGMIITELGDDVGDGIQNTGNATPSSVIAGYTASNLNNVYYDGTYSATKGQSGSAYLDVNFGLETVQLDIKLPDGVTVRFDQTTSFGVNFTVTESGDPGIANGTFQGPDGSSVIGTFNTDETGNGTYNVENKDGMSSNVMLEN